MAEPISTTTTTESPIAGAPAELIGGAIASNGAASFPTHGFSREHPKLPSSDELIFDDGIPMDSPRHHSQMDLLIETLRLHWADRQDFFVGGNNFVYFSPDQVKTEDYRGPDFYVVLDVDRTRERKGWVVWEEEKTPDVVIELLSESTADFDRTGKKEIYRTRLGAPEYFWYDPFSGELAGFELVGGDYVEIAPDERGRLVSRKLGVALARWEGEFQDLMGTWARWETLEGSLLPTKDEVAERERRRAEHERNRAEQERRRAEREHNRAQQAESRAEQERQRAALFAAKLREMGIDPETLK
jgi:Uma2 family endonuclease